MFSLIGLTNTVLLSRIQKAFEYYRIFKIQIKQFPYSKKIDILSLQDLNNEKHINLRIQHLSFIKSYAGSILFSMLNQVTHWADMKYVSPNLALR